MKLNNKAEKGYSTEESFFLFIKIDSVRSGGKETPDVVFLFIRKTCIVLKDRENLKTSWNNIVFQSNCYKGMVFWREILEGKVIEG